RLHDELFRGGKVSVVQVDQVFQSYQQARLALVQSEAAFQNALDDYKLRLGLPPRLPVDLDDSLLRPFQLTAPELEALQADLAAFSKFGRSLPQRRLDSAALGRQGDEDAKELKEPERAADWAKLQRRTRQLITLLTQMFVIQTQIRVNLIELPEVQTDEAPAL